MSHNIVHLYVALAMAIASLQTTGCSLDGDIDDENNDGSNDDIEANGVVTIDIEQARPRGLFGIDTNQISGYPASDDSNLRIDYAVDARHVEWVGRYINPDHRGHKAVTREEIDKWHDRNVSVVLIWEARNKYRTCSAATVDAERERGVRDGNAAEADMDSLNAPPMAAVYFTVDFRVTSADWSNARTLQHCAGNIPTRQMLVAYFQGVRSTFKTYPIGVYGSVGTVSGLLNRADDLNIQYAWQQTFRGERADGRATLLQYDINPHQRYWLEHPHEAGGLDFDVSVKGRASMWQPRDDRALLTPENGHLLQ